MKTPFAIQLAGLICLLVCIQDAWPDESSDDPVSNGIRLSQLQMHPVRTAAFWQQKNPGNTRQIPVGPAPQELIEFLHMDNAFRGYGDRPVPVSRDSEFLHDVEAAMASLPRAVRRIAERRLFYIALVRNLGGGTGYMDAVADSDGSAAGGFIVLDEEALDKTANAWASWREGSAFRPSADRALEVRIETPENDTRINAIRYILLHELGHVVDVVLGATPIGGGNAQNIADNGFYALSWISPPRTGDTLQSRFDAGWPERASLVFYSFDQSAYAATDAPHIYQWLQGTSFPTLYAATSPADDFAESFVNYVHVVLDQRPYEVRLRQGSLSEDLMGSCWESLLCAPKRETMKRLLLRAEILQ